MDEEVKKEEEVLVVEEVCEEGCECEVVVDEEVVA